MISNINPYQGGYRAMGHFRFWCQKVLPLVYDDSLSYYELLCKVVDFLNDVIKNVDALNTEVDTLYKVFDGLKKFVDNYFDNLDVQEEINNKLDEMAESGQLDWIVNRATSYVSSELGWFVERVGDRYNCSINKTETAITEAYLLSPDPPLDTPYCWFTNFIKWMLPLPLKGTIVISQPDSYFGTGINGFVENKGTLAHRLLFFARDVPPTGNEVTTNTSILVQGNRANVPEAPTTPVGDMNKREEAIAVAKSYYDARVNGRAYGYGANFITYGNSTVVNNSQGSAMMECDTLVSLVMFGIPYEDSPYATETPSYQYNFNDLVINPNNYTWTLPWAYNDIVKRKVTYTGVQNWYYWTHDMVFKNISYAEKGDIVVFRKSTPLPSGSMYFDGIRHTGILDFKEVNGVRVPYLYHITSAGYTGSNMSYDKLEDVIARGQYDVATDVYFARPNYA